MNVNLKTVHAVVDILINLYRNQLTSEEYNLVLSVLPKAMELAKIDVIEGADNNDKSLDDTFYRLREKVFKACTEVFKVYNEK